MNTNKQNKRFLSFILALVLVATMIFTPAVVWADHSHNGQDFTDSNTWNPGTITAGTNYHLATDTAITNSAHLSITVNPFTLCLYGKTLTINDTSANTGFVIGLPEGNGVFNLYDDGGGQIRLSDSDSGSIINIQKGTFNMYGGTLVGNGSISDGVRVSSGTAFNMYGGTITNNDYGVYLVSGAEFNMYGGTVTGSSIRGVDVNGGTFSVSGSAVVSGNIFNGKPRNVVLKTSENDVINVVGPLTAGASIGVTLLDGSSDPTIGVITSGWAISMGNADPTAYFKADAEGFYITLAAVNSTTEVAIQAGLATEPTISAITGADLTYGYTGGNIHVTAEAPSAHTLSYQWYKCDSDGSNELSIGGADSASYVILTGKNAGTYYYKCKVTATRDDNHMSASTMSAVAAVTVSPKAITVTAIDQTIAIGGSISQTVDKVNVTGLLEGHSISYIALTSSPTDVATTNGSITPSAATIMAGSDYVTSNYTATYLPGRLIVKGIPVHTAPTAKDLTYDGSAQELLNAGSTSDGTIQYRLNQFADFDTAIPSETAAGTYEVWWKIDGDEYHESIAATKVAITIKQKTVTASGLAVGNKIYDGTTDAALDISGATLTDVIPADAENVSVTGHAFFADKNAGDDKTATIVGLTLSGIRANNYKLSFTTTPAAANITAKAITIDSLGMHDKVYDGNYCGCYKYGQRRLYRQNSRR